MEEKKFSEIDRYIQEFLEYLEIEKNSSKLTIRNYRLFLSNYADEKGMTLKRVTQSYYVIALRSFLRFLIRNDHETLSPEKIDLPKSESKSLKFLEKNHLEDLF